MYKRQLWNRISGLDTKEKSIDWLRLSRHFDAPEFFIRKRSYRLFAKHLKLLEKQIESKTRGLAVTDAEFSEGDEEEDRFLQDDEARNFVPPEGLENLRSSKILNRRVPSDAKITESSLSELSNLSVSKSALEEALLDRLQL